jgi:16S rRNA (cytosine967-C5)-methyltransferase
VKRTVSPARQLAFEILRQVHEQGETVSPLLHGPAADRLSPEDRHLAQELTLGVLRRQAWLDFLIERYARRPVAKIDPVALLALRLGLYQLKCLSRIPAHAALHESVNLVHEARRQGAAPFVNAVLRAAQREEEIPAEAWPTDPLTRLAIETSHPAWLLRRWMARWGGEETRALATRNNLPSRQVFRYNESRAPRSVTDEWLATHGIAHSPGQLVPQARVVDQGVLTPRAQPVAEGWIYLQEEGSQWVARLATPLRSAEAPSPYRVWDACGAPGGKMALMASLLPESSQRVLTDGNWSRLETTRRLLQRQGAPEIWLAQADLLRRAPFAEGSFDQILVDAPCSGLGTLQKHPEIKWRLNPAVIQSLARRQEEMLTQAAVTLSTGGLLTYAVCSTEAEEGEQVVTRFRARHPGFREVTRERLVELGLDPEALLTSQTGARTFPHRHQTEAFFVAVLWKKR